MKYSVGLIIISDRASTGEREDLCLPVFRATLPPDKFQINQELIVPDEPDRIRAGLEQMIAQSTQLVFTSGGTGCALRDHTPEATSPLITRPTPGVDEAIRRFSSTKSRHAIFSRAISGMAGDSFIINLPGSPRAVAEILEFLLPLIEHPLKLMAQQITDCANESGRIDD